MEWTCPGILLPYLLVDLNELVQAGMDGDNDCAEAGVDKMVEGVVVDQ